MKGIARQGLTPKEEKFCLAIVAGKSQSDAYREAYDVKKATAKSVNELASRLMANVKIQSRVAELRQPIIARVQKSRAEWIEKIQQCAFYDVRHLIDETGKIKAFDQISDDAMPMVAGLEVTEEFLGRGEDREKIGETKKVKLVDRIAALTLFGKATGFLKEHERKPSPLEELGADVLQRLREEARRRIEAKGLKVPT